MHVVSIIVTTPPGNDKQPALHNYPHLHDLTYTWGRRHRFKGNKSSSARPEAQISALGKGLRRCKICTQSHDRSLLSPLVLRMHALE